MKVCALCLVCLVFMKSAVGQQGPASDHYANEVKVNLLNTALGGPEISYERLLSNHSALGSSVFLNLYFETSIDLAFAPYYRYYLGNRRCSGLFLEGHVSGMIIRRSAFEGDERNSPELSLGAGPAVGFKFLNRNGWLAEAALGLGIPFVNTDAHPIGYPRAAISIGKRF